MSPMTRDVLIAVLAVAVGAALSVFLVVAVLARLPHDWFQGPGHRTPPPARHPALRIALAVGRNVLGLALVGLGVILALPGVPGQGLLTILIGLLLVDFPGKYRLLRRLLRQPAIATGGLRLRKKCGRPPFDLHEP